MTAATADLQAAYELGRACAGLNVEAEIMADSPIGLRVLELTESYPIEHPAHVFFECGQRGLSMPEWVEGNRVGALPESGRSWNHRDGYAEAGVSILGVGDSDETDGTYLLFNGDDGRPRIRVAGWLVPYRRGADGEPLLVGAVQI